MANLVALARAQTRLWPVFGALLAVLLGVVRASARPAAWPYVVPYGVVLAGLAAVGIATVGWACLALLRKGSRGWPLLLALGTLSAMLPTFAMDPVRDTTITERYVVVGLVLALAPPVLLWVLFRSGGRGRAFVERRLGLGQLRAEVSSLLLAHAVLRQRTQELQTLKVDLLQAEEAERRRLAREIHDAPLQRMIHLMRLADRSAEPGLRHQLELAASELREIAEALRPRALDDLGVVGALKWLADDATDRGSAAVRFQWTGTLPSLDGPTEAGLFRITQEAIANCIKHSDADRIEIRARSDSRRVLIRVRDNGNGFDPSAARAGHGLTGMRERAVAVGAHWAVRSGPQGTVVSVCWRVPLGEES